MTDNEIIKAYKNCCDGVLGRCVECPVKPYGKKTCISELHRLVSDLINRQKAEIERLQNERIERIRELTREVYDTEIAEAKFEAIKEFARELKCGVPQETGVIRCADVDSLLKEMVGGADGCR